MLELSGPQWCERFPCSTSLDGLTPDFSAKVNAFIAALKSGGAEVTIATTYRPPERAYLMFWSWVMTHPYIGPPGSIPSSGLAHPKYIPPIAGVDIQWWRQGDDLNSTMAREAAAEMVKAYGIVYQPSRDSLHITRQAIDMTIRIPDRAIFAGARGGSLMIKGACDGTDPRIVAMGAKFGVIKNPKDAPHWSINGH